MENFRKIITHLVFCLTVVWVFQTAGLFAQLPPEVARSGYADTIFVNGTCLSPQFSHQSGCSRKSLLTGLPDERSSKFVFLPAFLQGTLAIVMPTLAVYLLCVRFNPNPYVVVIGFPVAADCQQKLTFFCHFGLESGGLNRWKTAANIGVKNAG